MGLLNRFFSSPKSVQEVTLTKLVSLWKHYRASFDEKQKIMEVLSESNLEPVAKLQSVIKTELVDNSGMERAEKDLFDHLKALDYNRESASIKRLQRCVGYPETRHKYVYELMKRLAEVLAAEMNIVEQLSRNPKNAKNLIFHLQEQFNVERQLVGLLDNIQRLPVLILAVLKGMYLVEKMTKKEADFLKDLYVKMQPIFGGSITEGELHDWANAVFVGLQDELSRRIFDESGAKPGQVIDGWHDAADFEFVNRSEFIEYVRAQFQKVRAKGPKSREQLKKEARMIELFTRIFREEYNGRALND